LVNGSSAVYFEKNNKMETMDSPVWAVYDRLRSARLSVKYYCWRLQTAERWSFWIDIVLVISAPTSAVAGLWFWQTVVGALLWKSLGVLSAVVAGIKPMLHLNKKIKDYEGCVSGYRTLDFDLMEIKTAIEQKRRYDAVLQAEFKRAQQRERVLVSKNPESRENARIRATCQEEVVKELPTEMFYIPEE
jgi:hypothetical protein